MITGNDMKMVLVIYNISVEDELMTLLKANGMECFSQWPRMMGTGVSTGPKMDNDVWPGANASIFTVMSEAKACKLLKAVDDLRTEIGKFEGVKAFMLNVEAMTGDF